MAKKHKKVRGLALGFGQAVGSLGRKRKREKLYQLRGVGAFPTASCCKYAPSTSSEMGTEAVWRSGPSLHLVLSCDFRLMQTLSWGKLQGCS